MDVKKVLLSTGIKTKEIRFLKPPSLPYIVYYDNQTIKCSDNKFIYNGVLLKEHSVLVELYVSNLEADSEYIESVESAINTFLVDYTREIEWIEEKEHFKISYEFEFITKEKVVPKNGQNNIR